MDNKSLTVRVPRRWVRIAMIVGVTALIVAPLTAVASHSFTDVPDTHTFHSDIEWLKDTGVTKGCNPPENTEFCPERFTSRGEMSAFMHRYAQFIGAEDGVPDEADTVDGFDANSLIRAEGSASVDGTADTVTIEAPVDGFLVVDAVAEGTDTDTWTCSIALDGTQAPEGFDITVNSATLSSACPISTVLPVVAGEHTVDLVADADTVTASSLSVVFVPFNGAGE